MRSPSRLCDLDAFTIKAVFQINCVQEGPVLLHQAFLVHQPRQVVSVGSSLCQFLIEPNVAMSVCPQVDSGPVHSYFLFCTNEDDFGDIATTDTISSCARIIPRT